MKTSTAILLSVLAACATAAWCVRRLVDADIGRFQLAGNGAWVFDTRTGTRFSPEANETVVVGVGLSERTTYTNGMRKTVVNGRTTVDESSDALDRTFEEIYGKTPTP